MVTCLNAQARLPILTARPQQVLEALTEAISSLDSIRDFFCTKPGVDFSHRTSLSFDNVIRIILGFSNSNLHGELSKFFGADEDMPTRNAFVMRRQHILPEALFYLFHLFMDKFTGFKTLKGYRILAADASTHCIPDNIHDFNNMVIGKPSTKNTYQVNIEGLLDALNETFEDFIVSDHGDFNEEDAFLRLIYRLHDPASDIIVSDRFYGSLRNISHLKKIGAHFVLRCKDIDSNGFASSYDLPHGEFDTLVHKTLTFRNSKQVRDIPDIQVISRSTFDFIDDDHPFYEMGFRLVRIKTSDDHFQLYVTDLPPETFSAKEIADIYAMRWAIETSFRRLKHILGSLTFHSYKHDSVFQEIYACLIMHNFTAILAAPVTFDACPIKGFERFVNFAVAASCAKDLFRGVISARQFQKRIRRDPNLIRPDRHPPRNKRLDTQPARPFGYRVV